MDIASRFGDDEHLAAARTAFGEARGEGLDGQVAVVWVLVNRRDTRGRWGDTIRDVAFQPYQFSCYGSGGHYAAVEQFPAASSKGGRRAVVECMRAADLVLGGLVEDPTLGATHYTTAGVYDGPRRPKWAGEELVRIGGHVFFKESKG